MPTLVADGTEDRLDPVANSRTLAELIPAAGLRLHPDAGHAFLLSPSAASSPSTVAITGAVALAILDRRLAEGAISLDEYEQRRDVLTGAVALPADQRITPLTSGRSRR